MDKINILDRCTVVLGSLPVRVDQIYTIAKPVADVINALAQVVDELKKEQEDGSTNKGKENCS